MNLLRLGSVWGPWRESDGSEVPMNVGDEIKVFAMEFVRSMMECVEKKWGVVNGQFAIRRDREWWR